MVEVIKIAVISWVFVRLGEPGEIFDWYQRLIGRLPERLWKPLGGCSKCLAGQIAFWYFIFFKKYNLFDHLFFVSATIFLVLLIDLIYGIKKD